MLKITCKPEFYTGNGILGVGFKIVCEGVDEFFFHDFSFVKIA